MLRAIGVLAVALVGAACTEAGTSDVVGPPVALARSSTAPVHRVSGGGRLDLGPFGLPDEQYGFTASLDADFNARGQFQGNLTVPDVTLHGTVDCLSVQGNDAWLRFVVTNENPVFAVGRRIVFMVRDNGPGGSGTPDQMSYFFPAPPGGNCDFHGFEPGLLEWKHGNIRVD